MNVIEINGSLYNLGQFVALEERSGSPTEGEVSDGAPTAPELVITFSDGSRVSASLYEHERIRAVIMARSEPIAAQDLTPTAPGGRVAPTTTLREAREIAEREIITRTLRRRSGQISASAADLGISRPTLYELIEKLGLSRTAWTDVESEESK